MAKLESVLAALCLTLSATCTLHPAAAQDMRNPEAQFNRQCAGCHGEGAAGGDRAPALLNNRRLRGHSVADIAAIIRNGTPGGMPPFALPADQIDAIATWIRSLNASAFDSKPPGDAAAGQQLFFGAAGCSSCHMVRGRGHTNGPDLSDVARKSTLHEIERVLDDPTSQMGVHTTATCPPWAFCPDEEWGVVDVRLRNGSSLRGFARNRAEHDLQLQTFDGKFHLLTDDDYASITREPKSYMPPYRGTAAERQNLIAYLGTLGAPQSGPLAVASGTPSSEAVAAIEHPKLGDWPAYNGGPGGNRDTELTQINTQNIRNLQLDWIYSTGASGLENTPIVSDGVMYVTAPGKLCALDARVGRSIWCYSRSGPASRSSEPNRGAALLGDSVFFVTSDAHLVCLNRITGAVLWDVFMPETPGKYSATAAPLVVGDLVISGIAGGDGPLRGFIAAYKAATGQQAWRFWTAPKRGDPASETWKGDALETGGAATWVTGSYDPESGLLYWTAGNPFPATDGDEREGTNLYTNCVLALEAKTGKLRWYYQFTPHDLHDWDATETVLLVDATYKGRNRKLLLQANRNGFAYVLDRTTGELLLGKAFVKKLNWASGIGPDGKPKLLPANKPTKAGVKTCPSVRGATNWYATAFNPQTRLFYVMAVEDCSIYTQSHNGGYEGYRDPSDPGLKYLRALDIITGEIVWEIPQVGPQEANYSGVLTTASGLVFYGETGGRFAAVDAKTGKTLWTFKASEPWKASPMTYMIGGRQYVAIASGGNILSFSLPKGTAK